MHAVGPEAMTLEALREELRRLAKPSQRAWARKNGLNPALVWNVIAGRRRPGPSLLRALGMIREKTYLYRKAPADGCG